MGYTTVDGGGGGRVFISRPRAPVAAVRFARPLIYLRGKRTAQLTTPHATRNFFFPYRKTADGRRRTSVYLLLLLLLLSARLRYKNNNNNNNDDGDERNTTDLCEIYERYEKEGKKIVLNYFARLLLPWSADN